MVRNESGRAGTGSGQLPGGRRARGQFLRGAPERMIVRDWVTFRAASQADAQSRTAEPRRVFCAARMFELCDREFEELWPGLERLLNNTGRPWDALDVRPHDNGSGDEKPYSCRTLAQLQGADRRSVPGFARAPRAAEELTRRSQNLTLQIPSRRLNVSDANGFQLSVC